MPAQFFAAASCVSGYRVGHRPFIDRWNVARAGKSRNGAQDAHAAKGSRLGISTEKIEALNNYAKSRLFSDAEKVALHYADAITDTRRDVELFARLQRHYDDDTIAELTMIIAWQNASSRFNHALRIPSQGFWKPRLLEAMTGVDPRQTTGM